MDPTTQSQLGTLRRLLLQRLSDLRADLQRSDAADRDASGAAEVSDTKDLATERQSASIHDAEQRRDIDELACVEAALHRLDNGTYGECKACGDPIPLQRLLAQPDALRCAACQATQEHVRKAQG
jgi:RNA polymerase-binding protein DksA